MARQCESNDRTTTRGEEEVSLFDFVGDWLSASDWTFSAHPEGTWYALPYQGVHADWRVIIDCSQAEASRRLLVYSVFPIRIPAGQRCAVSEFVARANNGMTLGTFELDFDDGEVRFRTVSEAVDGEMSGATVERLLMTNLGASDRYLPALLGTAFGRLEPSEAVVLSEIVIEGPLQ